MQNFHISFAIIFAEVLQAAKKEGVTGSLSMPVIAEEEDEEGEITDQSSDEGLCDGGVHIAKRDEGL